MTSEAKPDDPRKRPYLVLNKLSHGDELLMETTLTNSKVPGLMSLKVLDAETGKVELTGTEKFFRQPSTPRKGTFIGSFLSPEGDEVIEGRIVKDTHLAVQMKEGLFLSNPVQSLLLRGTGFNYDVF